VQAQRPPQRQSGQRTIPPNYRRTAFASTTGGPYQGRFNGRVVHTPRASNRPWGWNNGIVWQPAPIYWGGGFWGAFAIASLGDDGLYGSILDDQDQTYYPSYQVEPDSPGAQVLQNYQLQQTPCGPPDLVVMWGPDDSVICAIPNDIVGPGNYQIDPSTFNLVSTSQ
jgi:hypothetical protein